MPTAVWINAKKIVLQSESNIKNKLTSKQKWNIYNNHILKNLYGKIEIDTTAKITYPDAGIPILSINKINKLWLPLSVSIIK